MPHFSASIPLWPITLAHNQFTAWVRLAKKHKDYGQDRQFKAPPLDKMATISADDIFKIIFLNENVRISIQISLKFVSKAQIDNIPALV